MSLSFERHLITQTINLSNKDSTWLRVDRQ